MNNQQVEAERLISFVERIERLEEEKATVNEDIKSVYAEAKALGYDVKILREVVKLRKLDETSRIEQEEMLQIYKSAVGL